MKLLVAILLLVPLASADDVVGVCSQSCDLEGSTSKYESGMAYYYTYKGEVITKALVAVEDDSRLTVTAKVIIAANTPCDLKLQVADLVMEDSTDDSKWFSEAVQEHDLHFSYQHGAITHLCPHEDEEAVATNFKRGILSSLQMTVAPNCNQSDMIVSEMDVTGECDVKYNMEMNPTLQVTKTKMGCHSNSYIPHLPHSQYTNTEANAHLPFTRNTHVCLLQALGDVGQRGDISEGGEGVIWDKVMCTEEVVVPQHFTSGSNESLLADIKVSSTLTLEVGPKPMDGNFSKGDKLKKRESLMADLKAAVEFAEMKKLSTQSVKDQLDSVLESLSESENPEQSEMRPRLFSTLVQLLGHLEAEELEDVWSSSSSQDTHRKMLIDALVVCDGNACHALVAKLGEEERMLSPGQLNMWLTGLHMHISVHQDFVKQLLDLAESQDAVRAAAVMAASSVVYQLCHQQPSTCMSQAKSFFEYVDEHVGVSCGLGKTKQQQEHVKLVLRAIGNAGYLPFDQFPETCYMNRTLPSDLRITALQSYRRTSCMGIETPWKLLEDGSERSEVRIAAYLALVPCAAHSPNFFTRIHTLLQEEEVHQVYSFIWTHVKNLADQPGPSQHDQQLSKLARQHTLPNKFNNDAFRSSGNFRYAQFNSMMNVGGSVDANVVYSQDSYVPKQISANLTLDLFDNSFNFLDFGGEFSGIESIIESYFGEGGYFNNEDILKVLKSLRPKRSLIHDDKIQEFQKMYDAKNNKRKPDLENDDVVEEEPKTSIYVRLFGNEILYIENLAQLSPTKLLYQLSHALSSPKTFKIIDQEYMTPTILGFPLRLKVNATSSVSLQHESTYHKTRKLGLLLEGSLTPSIVTAMDEILLVDAFVSSSGLRRLSTQVAKTTIGGKVSVKDNELLELQVSVPDSEVMKVSSSVKVTLLKEGGRWEEPKSMVVVEEEYCIDTIEQLVGLKMCTSYSHGQYEVEGKTITAEPSKMEFNIIKTDTFNYYKLYIKKQESILEGLFDTPGSETDRKIHILFNMNPDGEGGYIVVRGAGYDIKGQYKKSEPLSEIQLQYLQDSKVVGKLELSLKRQWEGLSREYVPKFLVTMGPDKFTLEGKLKHNTDQNRKKVEASWEVEGAWHQKETDEVTQAFGTASGTFLASPDEFKLHLNSEYGNEPSQPHSITLTLDNNQTRHRDLKAVNGYASLQISQIPAGITVEYGYRPDAFELRTNTSLLTTQVSSEVVVKNVIDGDAHDTQLTLSLASQQLNFDYKASGIYKVSESGFQAEAEVNFDSSLKSKFVVMYLFEDEPMHVLAGLHLTLNDFVLQYGHSIDMTQPDHFLITASTIVGEGSARVHFEADYGSERPFNTSLEVFGGLGTQSVGLSSYTLSDLQWQNFTGKTTVKWFDWSGSLDHGLVLSETTSALSLALENGGAVELFYEMSPNQAVKIVVKDSTEDALPAFMIGAKKLISSELSIVELNVTSGDSAWIHLGCHVDSENRFNFRLYLLESNLNMAGKYSVLNNGTTSGDLHTEIMLPSGESLSSNLTLSSVKMENEHLIVVSASHEDSTIMGQLLVNDGGALGEEKTGVNFTLTTPHPDLQRLGFAFYKSAQNLYSGEIELDDFKILGDIQFSDPSYLLFKLEYKGGEECTSRLHLEHSQLNEHQYLSLATLALTQSSKPWKVILASSLDHSNHQHYMNTSLRVQAPVMPHPFHVQAMYNVTENDVQLEMNTKLETSMSILYHGKKELSWKRHLLSGLGKIKASWIEPVSVNMTYDHTLGGININVDVESEEDYIKSWSTEFSSEYSSAENIKANFFLTHNDLQITMVLVHNQFENNLKQQLEGSINTFTITYETDLSWDQYTIPSKAEGRLSLFNLLDHSLDLSLSHKAESLAHTTLIYGTFDDYTFNLDHSLEPNEPGHGWHQSLQANLRNAGVTTGGITLTADTHGFWPAINSSVMFESPWTDTFKANFEIQDMNSSPIIVLESFYNDKSLLSLHVMLGNWPSWMKSDLVLKATSEFFEDFKLEFEHDFNSGNLVFGDVTYGSDVHLHLGSYLKIKETWYEKNFELYAFNTTASITPLDIDFKTTGRVDINFDGMLKLNWNENSFSLNSSVLDGNIFEAEIMNSDINYHSELKYELGNEILLTLNFTLLEGEENIILSQTVVESVYPKLHAVSTLEFFTNSTDKIHGKLLVTADLTNIDKYSFLGSLEAKSNLLALKEYGGVLELDLNLEDELNWKGLVDLTLTGGDWDIRSGVNTSLEMSKALNYFEFGGKLHLLYGNATFDLKDVRIFLSAENNVYEMRLVVEPHHAGSPWSLVIIYNHRHRALKGFLTLPDSRKYELSLRLSSRTLTVDAHQVNEDQSKWQIVEGNINWILKRTKQLITMNMKSDIPSISKITGKIIVQRKRDLAVTATLKVNNDQFKANFRLSTLEPGKSFRVGIKVDNSIIMVFESEVAVEFSYAQDGFTFKLKIGLNEKPDWIEGNVKFSVQESYLKLRTPIPFLETFNVTVTTKTNESLSLEITIETPSLCWNMIVNVDRSFLYGSLNMNLDLLCDQNPIFDFKFQYNIAKNPIGILCELNAINYGLLFKFNTTGNLSSKGIDLEIETEVYPQLSLGVSLAFEVKEQYSLKVHTYDPPTNQTYFTLKIFVSPSKSELLLELPNGQSFIIKANYDFNNHPIKLNSNITNSIFDYELNANINGEASLKGEEGNIDLSFTSNTVLTHANISGMYSFSEELKDLNFKILTPSGDANGELRVLQDKDFLSIVADMTSDLHTFHKYHIEVTRTHEDAVEKLKAMITLDDIEYNMNILQKSTDKGTEGSLNVSLPYEGYEYIKLSYNDSLDGTFQAKLNVKYLDETYVVEAKHDYSESLYELFFNRTASGDEHVGAIRYTTLPNGHQIDTTLNIPETEGNPVSIVLKYSQDGLASVMFYSSHGLLGVEGSLKYTESTIVFSATVHLSLFYLCEINLEMTIPLQLSERGDMKLKIMFSNWNVEMFVNTGEHLKTGGVGVVLDSEGESTTYSLTYDIKDNIILEAQLSKVNVEMKLILKGTETPMSAGHFEVRSNYPGYEDIKGSWEVGYKNWKYYGQATLDVKKQEVLSVSTTLNTLTEGASYPWQNVRLTMLMESPFTSPHHLHAEYQLSTPKLLLYYQHGLDIFKIELNTDFGRNVATLALTGNIPIKGISTFDVNIAYNFLDSHSARFVVKVEDSTLEYKFDFSSDWRVGSVQVVFTSPFLKPGNVQLSWSLVPNSVTLKGFLNIGQHSGKVKMSLENTESSANFDCHITTSAKELSQFIISLSYKIPGNNNFDVSLAAKMNNNGILMKSSLDTKGEKLLLKFQGTFEMIGNRGSLEVDIGPSGKGYSASVVGKLPRYKKFFIDLFFDEYQLKLSNTYDAKEVFVVSVNYKQIKIQLSWTEYWSMNFTTEYASKGSKQLFRMTFNGFGVDPIELEANFSKSQSHILKLSLTSSLLPPFTLQLTYSNKKLTVHTEIGDKSYMMSGRANFRRLLSNFDARFESSDDPTNPIVMQAKYDFRDFFRGRMKAPKKLVQITLEWEEKFQVNVTGLRSSNMATIDFKTETPFQSLPHLNLGFQGEFFFTEFVGFNCTAFVEWSERVEMTAFAKLLQENVNVDCILTTSFTSIEKLSASLRLKPGELQLSAQYNEDMWKAVWHYEFNPFSVTCSIETPITNFEKISFAISIKLDDEKVAAEFDLMWPQEQTLGLQIEIKKWQMELNFQTPWKPFTAGTFTASLKTEGEELTFTSTIQLDKHESEVSLVLLRTNLKFVSSYSENSVTIGLAKLEYTQRDRNMRISLELQTPFKHLESLKAELKYGDNKISLMFEVNEVLNEIEGMYSANGGEFKADIPLVSNFSWELKAENKWMKAETSMTFKIAGKSQPLSASLKYDIKLEVNTFKSMFSVVHDEELMSVDVIYDKGFSIKAKVMSYSLDLQVSVPSQENTVKLKLEAPELGFESMLMDLSAAFKDESPFHLDTILHIVVKRLAEEPYMYKMQGNLDIGENQNSVQMHIKFEGNDLPTYEIDMKIPCCSIGLEIALTEDGKELFALQYSSGGQNDLFLPQKLDVQVPVWEVKAHLLLTLTSLNASLTLPQSSEHSLNVVWPDQFDLEEVRITAEFRSTLIKQGVLSSTFTCSIPENFNGKIEINTVFGDKNIHINGEYKYDEYLKSFKTELQITSNWMNDYSFQTNVQWKKDIYVTFTLETLEEEHSFNLHIDTTNLSIELMLLSPLLPVEEITFTGEISDPQDLSSFTFMSKLQADDQEVEVEVKFENDQLNHINSNIVLKKNQWVILSAALEMYEDNFRTDFHLSMELMLEELKNVLAVRYYDADWGRYFSAFLTSHLFTEDLSLVIINSHILSDPQSVDLRGPDLRFFVESNLKSRLGQVIISLGYDEIDFFVTGNISEEQKIGIQLKSTFENFEVLSVYVIWSDSWYKFTTEYTGSGEVVTLYGILRSDNFLGANIDVTLKTSFDGYEKFALFSPRYESGKQIKALIEYPGKKVGVDVNLYYNNIFESNFTISLYLPHEEFPLISLKYVMDTFAKDYNLPNYEIEARIGKIGFTLASETEMLVRGVKMEVISSLNEFKAKYTILITHAKSKRVRANLIYESKEPTDHRVLQGKLFYEANERIFLMAQDKEEEWVKVHIAWGADKILTLVTPKFLPAHVHVNLECGSLIDDYRLEVGIPMWSVYGLQLHKEVLPGGHHLSLLGQSDEYLLNIAGTLSVNACHFNNSLVFALNDNKMGYKTLLLGEPGFLSRKYTSDVQLLLHNRTLHHHTQATGTLQTMNLISNFTWNKKDEQMPPITFTLNYDDKSFFGKGKKYLSAVLSHPDIKDIMLSANLTRSHNSSVHGLAELVDSNSPEMKMVATMEVEPVREDGRHSVSLSLSQPVSNFSVLVDAQLRQEPLPEALCQLQYYSLTSERWHQVNLSASVESLGSSNGVVVVVEVPEKEWGHTWRGSVDSRPEEASFTLEGSSLHFGDTWKVSSVVKRQVPEVVVYLTVGKEMEVYEEARVSLGLHSPVEAGAALHHLSFGEWHQDAALGITLTSPHVLQAFIHFDPSLNCQDYQAWIHMFSPSLEVYDLWQSDVLTTTQNLKQWAATEAPAVIEALLNNETLQAIWKREASNWDYFVKDVQDTYEGISEDITTLWESVLVPVFEAIRDWSITMYQVAQIYFISLKDSLQHLFAMGLQWLQDTWHSFLTTSSLVEASVREQLVEWGVSFGQGVSTIWTGLQQWLIRFGEDVSIIVFNFYNEAKTFFIMVGETVRDYFTTVYQDFLLYFEELSNAFLSYGQDVLADFSGPCLSAITEKWDALSALFQNFGGMRVLTEFLQTDKYYSFLVQTTDWVKNKGVSVWNNVEETMSQAGQDVVQMFSSWSPSLTQLITEAQNSLSQLATQVTAEGLYSLVMSMTENLQESVSQQVSQLPMLVRESLEPLHSYLMQFNVFKHIDGVMMGIYDWGQSTWQKWSSGQHTDLSFLEQQLFLLGDALRDYLTATNFLVNQLFVFEPRVSGHIVYNQYLPVHWTSFMELPSSTFPTHLFKTESAASEAERLMDAAVPNPSLLRALMPSYTATAVIAGQHVTTFDFEHYQFLGSCSYLLAKDFEGGDFEVFGVYEAEAGATRLKSVVVHVENSDVTLSVDGTVTSNGNTDQVYNSTDYSALKLPDLFVSCSRALRGCALTVSGKYFGRLGGLLGNYNGDTSDDMHGPGGQVAHDAANLATLWAISPTPCYQKNQATLVEDYNDVEEEGVKECSQLFLYGNSPLSDCFHAIDPHSYFTHCIQGHTHPAFSQQDLNSPCTVVSSYQTQCWARHIHLPHLDKCKNETSTGCVVEGKEVPFEWSQVFEETSRGSADVVIIVELADCNADRDMASLFDYLSKQLERNNINDVQYSVVTVSEDETVTKSFLTKRNATDFLNTLTLSGASPLENIEAVVASTASQVEWRPGVSRSIVHIGCQACRRGDEANKALHQNDVTYHLVSSLMVEMAGTRKEVQARTRKLFGFDENLVYGPTDFKNYEGSEKLRLALRGPKGGCVSTALSTGGSVFNTNNWNPKKAIQSKKFLSVLAKRVTLSSSPPKCQECHCLKGDARTVPTCFKCFGNSGFLITHVDNRDSYAAKDSNSVTDDIKRSFQEDFLKSNTTTTMLRIL